MCPENARTGRARVHVPWWGWALGIAALIAAVNVAAFLLQRDGAVTRRLPGIRIVRPPSEVRALALDGRTLFAGGRDGLFAVDTVTLQVTRPVPEADLPLGQVRGLLVEAGHALWVAHEAGLTVVRPDATRTYTRADGLPGDRVNCVMRARDGRLWVGTDRGAAWLDTDTFHAVTARNGLLVDDVNAMAEDGDGGLWFGSYVAPRGGVSVLRGGVWHRVTPAAGLPHADITCFLPDGNDGMWVGTGFNDRGGAALLRADETGVVSVERTLTASDGLAGEKVRSLFRDPRGRLWFGSERDGLAVPRDAGGFLVLTKADGLSDDEVKAFAFDDDGVLWLGTRSGITLVRDALRLSAGGVR